LTLIMLSTMFGLSKSAKCDADPVYQYNKG